MSVDSSVPVTAAGPPSGEWLAAVNRQSLAVRLIATTVHDVNNSLQVMSGAAEVLALDPTAAAVARRTTSIVSQSAAATAVLQNLTAFVRADGSARDGARALVLAQQALAFRQHAFKKQRVTAAADGDDVECAMPRHQLQQVLLNLVVNAEQALAGQVGGAIRIIVRGGDAVTIDVTDNGPGLSEARQAEVFGWPPSPGGAAGALGIGLQVSRGLVEAVGGTLTLATPDGGGTSARVTVPLLRR